MRAIFEYQGRTDRELSFSVGDMLTVLTAQGGWLWGSINGQTGHVPYNYFTDITDSDSQPTSLPSTTPSSSASHPSSLTPLTEHTSTATTTATTALCTPTITEDEENNVTTTAATTSHSSSSCSGGGSLDSVGDVSQQQQQQQQQQHQEQQQQQHPEQQQQQQQLAACEGTTHGKEPCPTSVGSREGERNDLSFAGTRTVLPLLGADSSPFRGSAGLVRGALRRQTASTVVADVCGVESEDASGGVCAAFLADAPGVYFLDICYSHQTILSSACHYVLPPVPPLESAVTTTTLSEREATTTATTPNTGVRPPTSAAPHFPPTDDEGNSASSLNAGSDLAGKIMYAQYAMQATAEIPIGFEAGDTLVAEREVDGWIWGTINGQSCYVPSTYFQ